MAITLSFTMNTFAEKPKHKIVSYYWLYSTSDSAIEFRVLCAESVMFLTTYMSSEKIMNRQWQERSALVQMYDENNKPMTCPRDNTRS